MILIGVDPGLRTGIALVQVSDHAAPTLLHHVTADYTDPDSRSVGRTLYELVEGTVSHFGYSSVDDDIQLVIEKFVPEARKVDTTALEVIGELRQAIRDRDPWLDHVTKWHWQTRQEKDGVSGAVLRNLGLWLKGKEQRHVMDAARHTVVRLSKMNHRPTLEKGWPNG